MILVDFAVLMKDLPWFRQTPQGAGRWGNVQFCFDCPDADTLVVCDDIETPIQTSAPKSRRILVVMEPPGIRRYNRDHLQQFGLILSPFAFDTGGVPLKVTQTGLPWYYGIGFEGQRKISNLNYEQIRDLKIAAKKPVLSIICSNKVKLGRHRARLDFVRALEKKFRDRVAVFGRGFRTISDKAEAIAPYRYHLALENNDLGNFWTEKLADAFIGWSLPLYAGTNQAFNDFPSGSMLPINIFDYKSAFDLVDHILTIDPYERHLPALALARDKVITEHNLFALLARQVAHLPPADAERSPVTIVPATAPWSRLERVGRSLRKRFDLALRAAGLRR